MLKHLLYIIIGLGSLLCSTQSDSGIDDLPLAETEKILKEKTSEAISLLYSGKTDAYAAFFADEAVIPQVELNGLNEIKNFLGTIDIPPTEYTLEFDPIAHVDSTYIVSYKIKEASGFVPHQIETWKNIKGEWKIMASYLVMIEPKGVGGISKQRFILSSIILGVFLFLLSLIFKNAIKWKRR